MTILYPPLQNTETRLSFSQIVDLYHDDIKSFHKFLYKYIFLRSISQLYKYYSKFPRFIFPNHNSIQTLSVDITGDAYLKITGNLDKLIVDHQIISYINRTIQSVIVDHLKSHRVSKTHLVDLSDTSNPDPDSDSPTDPFFTHNFDHFTQSNNDYTETTLDFIKSETTSKQFDLLFDKYVNDLTRDEISAKHNIKPNTVKITLSRTKKQLRPLLERTGHTPTTHNRKRNLKLESVVFRGKNPKPFS